MRASIEELKSDHDSTLINTVVIIIIYVQEILST
jgi:hypothetical protein